MNNKPPSILVTGGAGYIGIHVLLEKISNGIKPVVIDNLSRGTKKLVPNGVPLIAADIDNTAIIRDTIRKFNIGAVIHLAGSIIVPE